jgi:hypothetical protein
VSFFRMDALGILQKGDKSALVDLIAKIPAENLQTSLDEILFQASGLGVSEEILDVLVAKGT